MEFHLYVCVFGSENGPSKFIICAAYCFQPLVCALKSENTVIWVKVTCEMIIKGQLWKQVMLTQCHVMHFYA